MQWYSNAQIFSDKIPKELEPFVGKFSELKRNRADLSDQYYYRYDTSESKDIGIFLSFFRESFAILGIVLTNGPADRELPPEAKIIHPFSGDNV